MIVTIVHVAKQTQTKTDSDNNNNNNNNSDNKPAESAVTSLVSLATDVMVVTPFLDCKQPQQ